MTLIQAKNVTKVYSLGALSIEALRGVSVSADAGEFVALAGPSGSGKTTLLNLLGCLEPPTSGSVLIEGSDTAALTRHQRTLLRGQKCSFVFQHFNLLPVLTAQENVEYALIKKPLSAMERAARARKALEQVGLSRFFHHKPRELSGGQQQRVAIARAMAREPSLILADEPTANLDHATGEDVLNLMKDLNRRMGTTFIFSTHDPRVLARADRVIRLVDGVLE